MKKFYVIAIILFLITNYNFGQGCSDAGFCTINSLKPHGKENMKSLNNQIKFGIFGGKTDNSIFAYGSYLEYNRAFGNKLGVGVKLTTLAQNGIDISVFGISDAFLNVNYKAAKNFNITLGSKIPFSKADESLDNLPLPMDYQASLGTFDFIIGVGYKIENLLFVAAIQQPLTQNENQFIAADYPLSSKLRTFQSTKKFKRSGDILLRISYPIKLNSKFLLTPSILPIYHLQNDKYADEFNVEKEIAGSKGITLNANLYLDYTISKTNSIQFNIAFPFIVRDARPDGLTRSFIASLEYKIKF